MSKKLINERPILLLPSLATEIGINNAIFLQQLHFWIDIAKELGYGVKHDGETWVYKSAEEWHQKDFPFWSVKTIRRIVKNLESQGLIVTDELNHDKWNHTTYYRIDYSHCLLRCGQLDHIEGDNLSNSSGTDRPHLTENTTKNTPYINTHTHAVGDENEWSPNLENLKAVLSTTRFSHLVDSIMGMPDFKFHLGNFNAHWENKTSLTENQKTRKFAQWITLEFEKSQKQATSRSHGAKKPHQFGQGFEQPTKRFGNYQEEQQFKDVN